MSKQFQMIVPEEIRGQFLHECGYYDKETPGFIDNEKYANLCATWGADQELEACCEWLRRAGIEQGFLDELRAARRPKPQSLKEQALEILADCPSGMTINFSMDAEDVSIIRRALETLPDDN